MFVNKLKHLKFSHVLIGLTLILFISFIVINVRMSSSRLLSVDYRVFGKVQGVFFRKFTKQKADELNLFGWVKNSRDGSVVGTIEGLEPQIDIMKNWLQNTGSPYSRIESCEFTNQKEIKRLEFKRFEIRH